MENFPLTDLLPCPASAFENEALNTPQGGVIPSRAGFLDSPETLSEQGWFWPALVPAGLVMLYGLFLHEMRSIQQSQLMRRQLIAERERALQAQMNPHFIFNALNSIQHFLVDRETLSAHNYVAKFGKLMRCVFEHSGQACISLAEEITALSLYLELESGRFRDGFDFEISVDPSLVTEEIEIPAMLIQPYVENAIWHGLMHLHDGGGKLIISFDKTTKGFTCLIEDNGIGRKHSHQLKVQSSIEHKSSGMKITEERLKLLNERSDNNFSVCITDLSDRQNKACGTRVEIQFGSLRSINL